MQDTDRDLREYYGQTNADGIYETLSAFNLSNRFNPVFKGFNSLDAFKTYVDENVIYTRAFNPLVSSLTEDEQNALTKIKNKVLEILGVSSDIYEFSKLEIDAINVNGILQAKHKTLNTCFVTYPLLNSFNFNKLKSENIGLFTSMTQFSWAYGKANDSFLNSLVDL